MNSPDEHRFDISATMVHDSTVDDTDEPHTDSLPVRTDGGSEAETVDQDEQTENEDQQESTDESEQQEADEDEQETADESEQQEADEDEQETAEEPATVEADDEAVTEQTGDVGVEPQTDDAVDESSEDDSESTPSLDGEGDTASIIEVRNQVIELSTDVIGRGLDGIIEVSRSDDNWRAVVEIIERRSVPDTQDILGQYEIELDESGEVIGYRRLEKYRRSDTGPSQR